MGDSQPLATRSGYLALGIMPFMMYVHISIFSFKLNMCSASATKVNYIATLVGTSHEKVQVFHRWSAFVMYSTSHFSHIAIDLLIRLRLCSRCSCAYLSLHCGPDEYGNDEDVLGYLPLLLVWCSCAGTADVPYLFLVGYFPKQVLRDIQEVSIAYLFL